MNNQYDEFPVNILEQSGPIKRESFTVRCTAFKLWQNGEIIRHGQCNTILKSELRSKSLAIQINDLELNKFIASTFEFEEISHSINRVLWSNDLEDEAGELPKARIPNTASLFFQNGKLVKINFNLFYNNTILELTTVEFQDLSPKLVNQETEKDGFDSKTLPFFVISDDKLGQFFNGRAGFKIEAEEKGSGLTIWNSFTGKYYLVCETPVSEKLVGISNNDHQLYKVPWELIREAEIGNKRYMVFTGWGDVLNGGHAQFEGHEIGISSESFLKIIVKQMNSYPSFFSKDRMQNLIGLENYNFE
jgi:hypothetical protein